MRKCKITTCLIATFLLLGIGSGVKAQSNNNEMVEPQPQVQESSSASYSRTDQFREGAWMWGMSAEQKLLSGSTAVAADAGEPSTIYVGGLGNIVVSNDSGSSWYEGITFYSFSVSNDADDNANTEEASVKSGEQGDMQANRLRDYLRHEIETQLGSLELADSLLDDITDDELLAAKDINDLETIAALNLDVESELTQIPLLMMEQGGGVSLSDYRTSDSIESVESEYGMHEEWCAGFNPKFIEEACNMYKDEVKIYGNYSNKRAILFSGETYDCLVLPINIDNLDVKFIKKQVA